MRCPKCQNVDIGRSLSGTREWTCDTCGYMFNTFEESSCCSNKTINLNELEALLDKTKRLLQDRQYGLYSWNECLREHLEKLHEMTRMV